MNWNAVMGLASTFALFLPVVLIGVFRLYTQRNFLVLFIYYLLTAVYNLMVEGIWPVPNETRRIFGTFNNYLDTPMMLLFLLFFCTDKLKKRIIQGSLVLFILYEILVAFIYGVNQESNVYILGPGIAVTVLFTLSFFIKQMRISIVQGRGLGKTLMLVSLLFNYSLFAIIYWFYYIQNKSKVTDIFLLYFITSFIASVIMSIGLVLIRKRIREVQELQLTRKELRVFFNSPVAGVK